MDYINKSKDELIAEIESLKAENARLNITFDKRVQEIEALNKSMLEASPDDITITDLLGNVIFVTPMALKIFRYDKVEQIIGRNLSEFVAPEDKERSKDGTLKMHKGESNTNEYKAIRGDGSIFDIEIYGQFIRDDKNNPTKMIFVVRDISERKQAERTLKESEEKLRQILESQNEGIGLVNEQEVFVFANPAANKIFETESLLAKSLYEFLTPSEIEKIKNQTANRKKGDSNIYELEIITQKGNVKYLSISSEPKRAKNGEYDGAYAVFSDITKRVEAEKEMLKFKTIADQANYGAVITTLDGTFLYVNKALSTMMGWDEDQLIGKSINVIHNEDQLSRVTEIFDMLKTKGGFASEEVNHARKDGSVFPTLMSGKVIRNQHDKAEFVSCTLIDISQRKKAEEDIKAKTAILTNLIVNSKEGIILENAARKVELTNQLLCNMFGIDISPEAMLGKDYSTAAEQNKTRFKDPDKFISESKQIIANREPVFNNEFEMANGRYFERDYIPTYIDEKYTGHLWKYRDITEKKKAEIELLKISQAIEQSPIMTIITNTKGIIEYINPSTTRITGYNKEELIGQNTGMLNSGKNIQTEYQELWATINSGKQWKGEFHNKKKNGELYWVGALVVPIFDGDNNIVNFISINEDITERKEIEQKLIDLNKNLEQKVEVRTLQLHNANKKLEKELTERIQIENDLRWNKSLLELMSNSSPLGFLVVDNRTDEILYFNKRFCKIWGIEHLQKQLQQGELKNKDIIPHCLLSLVDIPAFKESSKPLLSEHNRMVLQDEIAFTENRTVRRFSTQIRGENDEYYGRFYIFEDISERKNAEVENRIARMEAEKANRAKSEFLSRMSHELRTPMNSILGFAQLLEMGELNTSQRRGAQHIVSSGKHLLDLINQVLDIARIEAGRLQISIEPVKINDVIKEMMDLISPLADKNQIDIKFIETETNQHSVNVDRQSLKQILLNLLNNAIKYNKENGNVEIKTEITTNKNNNHNNNNNNNNYNNNNNHNNNNNDTENEAFIRISISDTGVGINQADISKLFIPFERMSAYNSQIEGTGLGLSVVKKLVEAMGGTYGVESEISVGSTFWFELPKANNPNENMQTMEIPNEMESNY